MPTLIDHCDHYSLHAARWGTSTFRVFLVAISGLRQAPLVSSLVWVDGSLVTPSDDLAPLLPRARPSPSASASPSLSLSPNYDRARGGPAGPACVALDVWSGALQRRDCAQPATSVCEIRREFTAPQLDLVE